MKLDGLDDIDRKLIAAVRRDNQRPARMLGSELGLSTSAVLRRLRRLRDDGIIIADRSIINPQLQNSALTIHLLLRLKDQNRISAKAFACALPSHPEVVGAWEIAGCADFLLKLQVNTMEEYDEFVRRALEDVALPAKPQITLRTLIEDGAPQYQSAEGEGVLR